MEYVAYLHKDSGSDFGVSFPDFPGCVTAGKTLAEAASMAAEALAAHIALMRADGDEIPEPSSFDDVENDPDREGAFCVLVSAKPAADQPVRVNIMARESQIERIDELASKAGMSRSAFMVQAALGSAKAEARTGSRPRPAHARQP